MITEQPNTSDEIQSNIGKDPDINSQILSIFTGENRRPNKEKPYRIENQDLNQLDPEVFLGLLEHLIAYLSDNSNTQLGDLKLNSDKITTYLDSKLEHARKLKDHKNFNKYHFFSSILRQLRESYGVNVINELRKIQESLSSSNDLLNPFMQFIAARTIGDNQTDIYDLAEDFFQKVNKVELDSPLNSILKILLLLSIVAAMLTACGGSTPSPSDIEATRQSIVDSNIENILAEEGTYYYLNDGDGVNTLIEAIQKGYKIKYGDELSYDEALEILKKLNENFNPISGSNGKFSFSKNWTGDQVIIPTMAVFKLSTIENAPKFITKTHTISPGETLEAIYLSQVNPKVSKEEWLKNVELNGNPIANPDLIPVGGVLTWEEDYSK